VWAPIRDENISNLLWPEGQCFCSINFDKFEEACGGR